jgi:hypothetical protein
MGWARRRSGQYYIRYRWVEGRCVAEYFGRGPVAELAADADRLRRLEREAAVAAWDAVATQILVVEQRSNEFADLCKLLAHAALVARGFHCHKGSEWRLRRERKEHVRSHGRQGLGVAEEPRRASELG